jgi:hypothetical protein
LLFSEQQPLSAQFPRVELERFQVADDTDTATQQTIELMCRYIRESVDDPMIQAAANWAVAHFGANSEDPAMRAWAIFWFVKHAVRFVIDEAPMFRLGEANQQDLLISPAVLIRMDDPAEDCDGFTMLGAALLKAVGVPFAIVTIAASPDDPGRWSHVFLMALLPSGPLPLDISHGSGPGWMVPASHTFRWQCWDADGKQVNIPRPRKHGLNGWVATGLGDDGSGYDVGTTLSEESGDITAGLPTDSGNYIQQVLGDVGILPNALPTGPTTTTPSTSSFNWTSFLNNLTTQAAGVAKVAEVNSLTTNSSLALSGVLGSLLPLVLVAIGGYLLVSALGSKR